MNTHRWISPHLCLLAVCLPAWGHAAPIYHWVDEQGRTHYSDRAPQDQPSRELDPRAAALSTIGGSALREDELDLLQRYADEAQARQEQAEQARQQNPPPIIVVNPPPPPAQERYILPAYTHQRYYKRNRWGIDFNVQIGSQGSQIGLHGGKPGPWRPDPPARPHPPAHPHPPPKPPAARQSTSRRGPTSSLPHQPRPALPTTR